MAQISIFRHAPLVLHSRVAPLRLGKRHRALTLRKYESPLSMGPCFLFYSGGDASNQVKNKICSAYSSHVHGPILVHWPLEFHGEPGTRGLSLWRHQLHRLFVSSEKNFI